MDGRLAKTWALPSLTYTVQHKFLPNLHKVYTACKHYIWGLLCSDTLPIVYRALFVVVRRTTVEQVAEALKKGKEGCARPSDGSPNEGMEFVKN